MEFVKIFVNFVLNNRKLNKQRGIIYDTRLLEAKEFDAKLVKDFKLSNIKDKIKRLYDNVINANNRINERPTFPVDTPRGKYKRFM